METQIADRLRAETGTGTATAVAYVGAAAFVLSAAWYGLAAKGVTVASAPSVGPHVGVQQGMHIYYRWLVTTLPQERLYISVGIAAFLCLAGVAGVVQDLVARDSTLARVCALTISSGALLWIAGSVVLLGGHRAVGLMATHANPIETVYSIAFTVDTIGDALALAAFAVIGAGMLALAWVAARQHPGHRAWVSYTVLTALVLLVTAGTYAVSASGLTELMLIVLGVVLLPAWLVWTGRTHGMASRSPDAV
jgi:hypothetical protein